MRRFVINSGESNVVVFGRSSLHPFRGSGPVSSHFDAKVSRGRVTGVLRDVREGVEGRYRMSGELTLHGRSCSVDGDATIDVGEDGRWPFDGVMELDIRDFGIEPPKLLMFKVSPEIEVRLTFVADGEAFSGTSG
jgi:hypothetical protein